MADSDYVADLDDAHWKFEGHKQRMTTKQWRDVLLSEQDKLITNGRLRQLIGKNLGAGVYEVSKKPLKE